MNRNLAWATEADVLQDLKHASGKAAETFHMDQFVVQGERPPPIRRESQDEEQMQYYFGGEGCSMPEDDVNTPDLNGISKMLQMVNDLDDKPESDDAKIIFRNAMTDEISISKLNPNVREFVPFNSIRSKSHLESNQDPTTNIKQLESNLGNISNDSSPVCSTDSTYSSSISALRKIDKEFLKSNSTSIQSRTNPSTEDFSLEKKIDTSKMKSEEIESMKAKIKSKIVGYSNEESIQRKKEKNVAIATLLKLCTAPPVTEKPVTLVTPQYFVSSLKDRDEVKPIEQEATPGEDSDVVKETVQQTTTSNKINEQYIDPIVEESVLKVNSWFNDRNISKTKAPPTPAPIVLKEAISFKKKSTTSLNSERSREKKVTDGAYVPSVYANNLLKKYEHNARSQLAPKEDLGSMLERKLKERDEQIKKKLLEKSESTSPAGRSLQ